LAEKQAAFRQKEEDERGLHAAEAKKVKLAQQKEREKVRSERARKAHDRMVTECERQAKLRAEEERRQWEEVEAARSEEYEKARRISEEREAERQRRMPWECNRCQGSGQCSDCKGRGYHMGMFLVSNVDAAKHPLEFGKKSQGCETCGGLVPGIRGQAEMGTGVCVACDGEGKIWPKLSAMEERRSSKTASQAPSRRRTSSQSR
jgi:hypothetical protein